MSKETRERVGRSPSPAAPRTPAPTPRRRDEPKREGAFSPLAVLAALAVLCVFGSTMALSHHVIDEHAPRAGASGPGAPAAPDAASRAAAGDARGGLQSRLFALEQRQKLIDSSIAAVRSRARDAAASLVLSGEAPNFASRFAADVAAPPPPAAAAAPRPAAAGRGRAAARQLGGGGGGAAAAPSAPAAAPGP